MATFSPLSASARLGTKLYKIGQEPTAAAARTARTHFSSQDNIAGLKQSMVGFPPIFLREGQFCTSNLLTEWVTRQGAETHFIIGRRPADRLQDTYPPAIGLKSGGGCPLSPSIL